MSVASQYSTGKPWNKVVATVLTCVALGPPIGAIVFSLSVSLFPWLSDMPLSEGASRGDTLAMVLFVALFAIPFSYVLGGLQALGTGLVFAAYGWRYRILPLWLAIATGLGIYGLTILTGINDANEFPILFLITHLVPALACWLIVRSYWRA